MVMMMNDYNLSDGGVWIPKNYTFYNKPSQQEMSQRKIESLQKLAEIQNWGRRRPDKFINEFVGFELLDVQTYILMNSWSTSKCIWLECRGAGKDVALDTKILKADGTYTTMGEVKVGDYVVDADGNPTRVIGKSPVFTDHKCYEVEFEDGEKIIAGEDHLWAIESRRWKGNLDEYGLKVLETKKLAKDYVWYRKCDGDKEYKYRVPIATAIKYEQKDLPIHPYILGIWLGDGCSSDGYITSHVNDYDELCKHIKDTGYQVTTILNDSGNNKKVRIANEYGKPLLTILKEMNLFKNKHIPKEYMLSSIEQRFELIKGLMDTDGSCDDSGRCEFSQKSESFMRDFQTILDSLGIKNTISYREGTAVRGSEKLFSSWRCYFTVDKERSCFKFERKKCRLKDKINCRRYTKTIVSIKEVPTVKTQCICVDNPRGLFLCGERMTVTHNSSMIAIYIMAKSLLFPNYRSYIAAGSSDQAIETFMKIEALASDAIESATGLTKYFLDELRIANGSGASGNGFVHNPMGYTFSLWNNSKCVSLNSNIDKKRGKRAELVVFDETGFLPEEMLNVYSAFTAVNKAFKLGRGTNVKSLPTPYDNQTIFASSASSVDTPYYKRVIDYTKKFVAGDPNYFICDIQAPVMINATYNGEKYPAALLQQELVDSEIRANSEKGNREFFNIFTTSVGVNQIIPRSIVIRNTYTKPPVLYNTDSLRNFALAYDPAHNTDNSVVGIGEIYEDPKKGLVMDIVNCVNFLDLGMRKKRPKIASEQKSQLKQLMCDYNGKDALDWENIHTMIDAGSGGGGNQMPPDFFKGWKDSSGKNHRGMIDSKYSEEYVKANPGAVKDVIEFIEPSTYKADMFEALITMMEADLIRFPAPYDGKGYLSIVEYDNGVLEREEKKIREKLDTMDLDPVQYEIKLNEEISNLDVGKTTVYKLSPDEEAALKQIDAMKEEIVNICRIKRDGSKDGFKLPSHKDADLGGNSDNTMHDDRAYVLAMLGYELFRRRQEHLRNKKRERNSSSLVEKIKFRKPNY